MKYSLNNHEITVKHRILQASREREEEEARKADEDAAREAEEAKQAEENLTAARERLAAAGFYRYFDVILLLF